MPPDEQEKRVTILQKRLKRYNVEKWANDFMNALENTKENRNVFQAKLISETIQQEIIEKFKKAKNRILFLDYDGTLVNFVNNPEHAFPDESLITLIQSLTKLKNTKVVLISGRDTKSLGEWWLKTPVVLIAEHGVWIRKIGKDWTLSEKVQNNWMESIRPVIETFVDRTPGTFLEEKSYSLAWHYRKADPELGEIRASELSHVLKGLISNHDLNVLDGNKVLEIKSSGVNKGKAANKLLLKKEYDFIFAIGDDWTDEYLFKELPESTVTVKVGMKKTAASYYLKDTDKVRELLSGFSKIK
jgi:trehalose 6-phosphate synthase/phosphatase